MENFTFIKLPYTEGPTTYFAVSPEEIKTMDVSSTYGDYGQNITADEAGDSVTLETKKALKVANDAWNDFSSNEDEISLKFSLGDYVAAYDHSNEFDAVVGSNELESGVDYEYNAITCKGLNYWNGNNWSSVIVESENGEPEFEVVSDEDLIEELNKAIQEKEFKNESLGLKHYQGNGYQVTDNNYQDSWATWELVSLDDLDK